MSEQTVLPGVLGTNPLGFLAALGLLRVMDRAHAHATLGFLDDGTARAVVSMAPDEVVNLVASDASAAGTDRRWVLEYKKLEKKGEKIVADLKAPPPDFATYLRAAVGAWLHGDGEAVGFAAAYGTSVTFDGKGNTKPTAFHFTAANQQFLGAVEGSRGRLDEAWIRASLLDGSGARSGSNLRWDPTAERNYALMAENPTSEGTRVDAPLEWLAFRGLPLFPSFPIAASRKPRILTTGVKGRGDDMEFSWPLWSTPATLHTVRSLVQMDTHRSDAKACALRDIFALCDSSIRRTSQGFGNFGPATVRP